MKFFVITDVLIHFRDENLLVSNTRSREHVTLCSVGIEALSRLYLGATKEEWMESLVNAEGSDATETNFGEKGLHTDPSFIDLSLKNEIYSGEKLFELLFKRHILVKDYDEYFDFFNPRRSIFDFEKMGNFHEKVGDYLIKKREEKKWEWWHNQKFSKDGEEVTNLFYKTVQEKFIRDYLKKNFDLKTKNVLDFGCGNGYFSNIIRESGAEVLGVDNNQSLIDIARKNYSLADLSFVFCEDTNSIINLMSKTNDNKFDYIIMQDVLSLILDHNIIKNGVSFEIDRLLESIFSNLKPNGLFVCVDPNPIFWLALRLGSKKHPISIVTEYRHKKFNTTPNQYEVVNALSKYGLGLVSWEHPRSDRETDNDFWNNCYAIWDFMIFRKYA